MTEGTPPRIDLVRAALDLRVRTATFDDLTAMVSVIRTAYVEFIGVLKPPSGANSETVESLRVKLEQGGGLLALDGVVPVGCLLYEPQGEGLYVGRVAVIPSYRRYGAGRMLMQQVETLAREQGRRFVTLGVRLQLTGNFAFYGSLGYVVVKLGTHPGFDEPTFATMEKRLDG